MDTSLVDKAIVFATKAHAGVSRKGNYLPYIVHPLEAMAIVASITDDQELMAAAALHDTLEDTPTTYEDLKREFGKRVADLVLAESDHSFMNKMPENATWLERKKAGIERLKNESADVKIVSLGDKLSNIRAMHRDYLNFGDFVWERFNATPDLIAWRYRELVKALGDLKENVAYEEFAQLVEHLFGLWESKQE